MYEHKIDGIFSKTNWKEEPKRKYKNTFLSYWNILKKDEKFAVLTLTGVTLLGIALTLVFNHLSAEYPVFIYRPY